MKKIPKIMQDEGLIPMKDGKIIPIQDLFSARFHFLLKTLQAESNYEKNLPNIQDAAGKQIKI